MDVTGVYAATTLFGAKISFLQAPIATCLFISTSIVLLSNLRRVAKVGSNAPGVDRNLSNATRYFPRPKLLFVLTVATPP